MIAPEEFVLFAGGHDDVDIPVELKESVARHQRHLAALAHSLRSAGLDEAMIEASVRQLISSYEAELIAAMKALMRTQHHA